MSVILINLTHGMCRWPLGDPKEENLQFCGAPSDPSHSYCEKHMVMAHAPDNRRRKSTA